MASVLVSNVKNWQRARTIANSFDEEAANLVRAFMRGCGIDIPLNGGYDWMVVRFVFTFQECLVLSGKDKDGLGYDYFKNALSVDGVAGPNTLQAMERSKAAGYKCWKYLKWSEISTKDPNKVPTLNNPVIYTTRPVVKLFILMRYATGAPIVVASWFRNLRWNTIVGGANLSQHQLGLAIDFNPHPKLTEVVLRDMIHEVSHGDGGGIGVQEYWKWRNGWRRFVRIIGPSHVDIRKIKARWRYKVKI